MVLQNSGPISFSQIRNEFGGPSNSGPISLSQYTTSGIYGSGVQSNPNNIPYNSGVKFSNFRSAAKYIYPNGTWVVSEQASQLPGGWSITNQDANAKLIWVGGNAYQNANDYPIVNYPINFYYIFQNTTGVDINGTIYVFMDDNLQLYLNNTNIYNSNYTGGTLSTPATFKVGQNIIKLNVVNTGGPGSLIMTFKNNSNNSSIIYSNSNWYADVNCLLDYTTWLQNMTIINWSGNYPATGSSGRDVQLQLGFSTGNTLNTIYRSVPIQNYSKFVIYFEIYIAVGSGADGLCFYAGGTSPITSEFGGYNSFAINFQLYVNPGVYLVGPDANGVNTVLTTYLTSGHIASEWQPVFIYYTKGTVNTWQVYWNNINVFNYSDPNNASYVANAGNYFGFTFRDGGVAGSSWIRHIQIYNSF